MLNNEKLTNENISNKIDELESKIKNIDELINESKNKKYDLSCELGAEKDSNKVAEYINKIQAEDTKIEALKEQKSVLEEERKKYKKVLGKTNKEGFVKKHWKKALLVITAASVIALGVKACEDKNKDAKEVSTASQEETMDANADVNKTIESLSEEAQVKLVNALVENNVLTKEELDILLAEGFSYIDIIKYCFDKDPRSVNIVINNFDFSNNSGTINIGKIETSIGCDTCGKETKKPESTPSKPNKPQEPNKPQQPNKPQEPNKPQDPQKPDDSKDKDKDIDKEIERIINAFAFLGFDSGIRNIECDPLSEIKINIPNKAKANEVIEKGLAAFADAKAKGAQSRQTLLNSKLSTVTIVNPYDKNVKYTKDSLAKDNALKLTETDGLKQEYRGELKFDSNGKLITNDSKVTVEEKTTKNSDGSVTKTETKTYENTTIDPKTGEGKKQTTTIITEVETKDGEAKKVDVDEYQNKNKNEGIIIDQKQFEKSNNENLPQDGFITDENGNKKPLVSDASSIDELKRLRNVIAQELYVNSLVASKEASEEKVYEYKILV